MQLPLTRETVTEAHARNQADARARADANRLLRSKGHEAIIGEYEYFTVAAHLTLSNPGSLFRAPTHNAIDRDGYRLGARYVCGPGMAAYMLAADRACHAAYEQADRTGQPVIVWRTTTADNPDRPIFTTGEQPDPCAVLYTTARPEKTDS